MPDYTQALMTVNVIKMQLAMLARQVVNALGDQKISGTEAMMLGMSTMQLGTTLAAMLQTMTHEQAAAVLYVLEHAELTLPPGL